MGWFTRQPMAVAESPTVELERSMNNAPFELFKEEEFKIVRYAIDPASNSKDPDLKRIFKKKEVRDDSHVLRE